MLEELPRLDVERPHEAALILKRKAALAMLPNGDLRYLGSNTLGKLFAEKSTRQAPFLEVVAGDGVHVADVCIAKPR
jgi:hypothetical protein